MATLPYSPKAEAAVGLLLSSRSASVIGGLTAGSGTVVAGVSYGVAATAVTIETGIAAVVFFTMGIAAAVIGLVLLDEKEVAQFKFMELNNDEGNHAIAVYNSEVDLLNAVRERIEIEYDANPKVDTKSLWAEYGQFLSAETMTVAQSLANGFVLKLEPVKK
jgi:hypothetical protein